MICDDFFMEEMMKGKESVYGTACECDMKQLADIHFDGAFWKLQRLQVMENIDREIRN